MLFAIKFWSKTKHKQRTRFIKQLVVASISSIIYLFDNYQSC